MLIEVMKILIPILYDVLIVSDVSDSVMAEEIIRVDSDGVEVVK
jgi:hypothetical protein